MIVRNDIKPDSNIYYLGAVFISHLKQYQIIKLENFIKVINIEIPSISINNIFYTLDWLYLLGLIELTDEGDIRLEIK